jgi:ribosomal protein S27E
MFYLPEKEWIEYLTKRGFFMGNTCPDCGTGLLKAHADPCNIHRCSICGKPRLRCWIDDLHCIGHDRAFARWRGYIPGELERSLLGMSKKEFTNIQNIFFKKADRSIGDPLIIVILDQELDTIPREFVKKLLNATKGGNLEFLILSKDAKINRAIPVYLKRIKPDKVFSLSKEKIAKRMTKRYS